MQNILDDICRTIPTGGSKLCYLRFADDIDLMAGSNTEFLYMIFAVQLVGNNGFNVFILLLLVLYTFRNFIVCSYNNPKS